MTGQKLLVQSGCALTLCADPFLDDTAWVSFATTYCLGIILQKVPTKNIDWKMHAS